MINEIDIQLWFASLYTIGAKTEELMQAKLLEAKHIFNLSKHNLYSLDIFNSSQLKEILQTRNTIYIDNLKALMQSYNATFLSKNNKNFPTSLLNIPNIPRGLFSRGRELINKPTIAIIGSRKPTNYGLQQAYNLSYILSNYFTIVSGMAKGIDEQAHIACLDAGNYSIGVLGTGVDKFYPKQCFSTYMRMLESSTLISEYSMGIGAKPWHFPMRNRIISGLSDAIIVIEASKQSGTSLTVQSALEQGKDIFALPGRIDDTNSLGCLNLIQDGAYVITSYQDILSHFNIETKCKKTTKNKFTQILSCLNNTYFDIDDILENTDMKLPEVSQIITEMEVKGIITCYSPGIYMKNQKLIQ